MTNLEIFLSRKLEEVRDELANAVNERERFKMERDMALERLKALERPKTAEASPDAPLTILGG